MKWKRIYSFAIGLSIAFVCVVVIRFYSNPYPCQVSCIGCNNLSEMFIDNIVSVVFGLIMLSGFGLMYFSIAKEG